MERHERTNSIGFLREFVDLISPITPKTPARREDERKGLVTSTTMLLSEVLDVFRAWSVATQEGNAKDQKTKPSTSSPSKPSSNMEARKMLAPCVDHGSVTRICERMEMRTVCRISTSISTTKSWSNTRSVSTAIVQWLRPSQSSRAAFAIATSAVRESSTARIRRFSAHENCLPLQHLVHCCSTLKWYRSHTIEPMISAVCSDSFDFPMV